MEHLKRRLEREFNNVINNNKEEYYSDKEKESYVRGFNDAIQMISIGYDIYIKGDISSHN